MVLFTAENSDTVENVRPTPHTQSETLLEYAFDAYGISLGHAEIPETVPSVQKAPPAHGKQ